MSAYDPAMTLTQLLPGGEAFPRAPVRPQQHDLLPRDAKSTGAGRRRVVPPRAPQHHPTADTVVLRNGIALTAPRQRGESAQHGGGTCCGGGRSSCGVARKGKRPIR